MQAKVIHAPTQIETSMQDVSAYYRNEAHLINNQSAFVKPNPVLVNLSRTTTKAL